MDLNNINEDWEKEAPTLAAMRRANPFAVPDKYFDNLEGTLDARVRILSQMADDSSKIFATPPEYFESLQERISASVMINKLKEEAPSDGLIAPDLYFDELSERITSKIRTNEKRGLVKQLFPSWINYAAAACITAIIGLTVFINNQRNSERDIDRELSRIPEEEIVKYLQTHTSTGDAEIIAEHLIKIDKLPATELELSEKEIEQYLDSTL